MGTAPKKKQDRYRRKLFDGRTTAEEVHRRFAFPPDAVCRCGSKKIAMRARSFAPLDWILESKPQYAMKLAMQNNGRVPVVDFCGPGNVPVKHVRIGDTFACDLCKKDLERAAAKGPSFIMVHFDFGPGPENALVQVPE